MCKKCMLFLCFFLFSTAALAAQTYKELQGGINANELTQCLRSLKSTCPRFTLTCLNKNITTYSYCKQTQVLLEHTNSLPASVENYQYVHVVRVIELGIAPRYNFLMVDKIGQIILPNENINIENAPGFLALKQRYPNAMLSNVIMDFPQAVFLTQSVQKLLVHQQIIETVTQKEVGYAKVLYSFSASNGQYLSSAVMRIMPNMDNY